MLQLSIKSLKLIQLRLFGICPWSVLANRGSLKQFYSQDALVSPDVLFGSQFFANHSTWSPSISTQADITDSRFGWYLGCSGLYF